jgi:hypothetical protein
MLGDTSALELVLFSFEAVLRGLITNLGSNIWALEIKAIKA